MAKVFRKSTDQSGRAKVADAVTDMTGSIFSTLKWFVPSLAALFAVVGYVIESAYSSLLGGVGGGSTSLDYAGAAADFAYDLPTIAVDVIFSILDFDDQQGYLIFVGNGKTLVLLLAIGSLAWWLPWLIGWFGNSADHRQVRLIAPMVLMVLLGAKFVLWDAPLLRIESVVVGDSSVDYASSSWAPHDKSGINVDGWIRANASALWGKMVCSRNPSAPPGGGAVFDCQEGLPKDRRLMEEEFSVRFIACLLVATLSWRVARGGRSVWRQGGAICAFATILTLPYAYGKLLKPTVFEFGRIDLAAGVVDALAKQGESQAPMEGMVLVRRPNAVDFLVEGKGLCANGRGDYLVTRVWSVSNSQLLAVREISRRDVISWKVGHEQSALCLSASPPAAGGAKFNK